MFDLSTSAVEVVPVSSLTAPKPRIQKMGPVERALAADLALSANCWHLSDFAGSLEEGVLANMADKGPDPLRPFEPFVVVGGARVHRDGMQGQHGENLFGSTFHPKGDGSAVIRRAVSYFVRPTTGKGYSTLRKPRDTELTSAILFVRLALPVGHVLRKGEHTLQVNIGYSGDVRLLAASKGEYLFEVQDDKRVNLMYGNGSVRSFVGRGNTLRELRLSFMDMAKIRVDDAFARLARASVIDDEKKRKDVVYHTLASIADLLHLTEADKVSGQEIRKMLLDDFFLKVAPEHLSAIHRRLMAVLSNVDKVLLPLIRMGSVASAPPPAPEVLEAVPASAPETAPSEASPLAKKSKPKKPAAPKRTARSLAELGALVE